MREVSGGLQGLGWPVEFLLTDSECVEVVVVGGEGSAQCWLPGYLEPQNQPGREHVLETHC